METKQNGTNKATDKLCRNLVVCSLVLIVFSLAFLAFACTKYYTRPSEGFADHIGELLAYALCLGLVFAFIWRTIPRDKKGMAFFCFILIICFIAHYKSFKILSESRMAKKSQDKLSSIIDDVIQEKVISSDNMDENTYGKMAPFLKIIADFANDVQRDSLDLYMQLESCNLESIFEPRTLTDPLLLEKCKSNYEKADNLILEFENKLKVWGDQFMSEINNSNLDEKLKERALSKYRKETDRNLKEISELFAIRKDFISEGKRLLTFMQDKQANCRYQNNKIIFKSETDGVQFQVYWENLISLVNKETSWVDKAGQEALEEAGELKQQLTNPR